MYASPDEMLKEISECMDANIISFEKGDDIDMQPFDDKVRRFCAILGRLPQPEAKKYEGSLHKIIERLTLFIPKIEARKNEMEEKINALNKRSVAYNAYGNALILALQTVEGDK